MSVSAPRGAALAAALTLLIVPAGAVAKGGGGGGGGGGGAATPPAPAAGPCLTSQALNSGQIDKPASKKPISLDFKLTNCGSTTVATRMTLVGTSSTLRSADPVVVEQHVTDPYAAPSLTLKPGESRTISAPARIPTCGCDLWGVNLTYNVEYVATTTDAAGAVLATATSGVNHQGGV
jgi:hypothetical protein